MKKVLSMLLCLVMICGVFAGCSDGGSSTPAYAPGDCSGDVYKSEWIGIKYTKNSDMVYATDDELKEMFEISADALYEDSATGEQLIDYAKANNVIEMMASNVSTGDNVLVMTEKLPLSNVTMEQYIESFDSQMKDQGYTFINQTTCNLAGKEFTQLEYSTSVYGIDLNQNYYLFKQDNRMVAIIATYFDADGLNVLLDGFSAYSAD